MFETVAWISIIVGFVVVIAFSLAAMLLTRRREQNSPPSVTHEEAAAKVDAAADAALNEINKTAEMILTDMNEKYQTLLFLYELMEEKMKTAPKSPAPQVIAPAAAPTPGSRVQSAKASANKAVNSGTPIDILVGDDLEMPVEVNVEPDIRKPVRRAVALNTKSEKIIELFSGGMLPAEIAKELDIGQGEVKLVLDLSHMG